MFIEPFILRPTKGVDHQSLNNSQLAPKTNEPAKAVSEPVMLAVDLADEKQGQELPAPSDLMPVTTVPEQPPAITQTAVPPISDDYQSAADDDLPSI